MSASVEDRNKAIHLTNEAFALVEQGRPDQADTLLKRAITTDPDCGDAYNELAFVHGRMWGDLETAWRYAQRAVECDPANPKFHNAVLGITMARIARLQSLEEIRAMVTSELTFLEKRIAEHPDYPGSYLSKATMQALGGEGKSVWKGTLRQAEQVYLKLGRSAAGVPIGSGDVRMILRRIEEQCKQAGKAWKKKKR
jgi:tetratricopeptide (TPR) repeat protein